MLRILIGTALLVFVASMTLHITEPKENESVELEQFRYRFEIRNAPENWAGNICASLVGHRVISLGCSEYGEKDFMGSWKELTSPSSGGLGVVLNDLQNQIYTVTVGGFDDEGFSIPELDGNLTVYVMTSFSFSHQYSSSS